MLGSVFETHCVYYVCLSVGMRRFYGEKHEFADDQWSHDES